MNNLRLMMMKDKRLGHERIKRRKEMGRDG